MTPQVSVRRATRLAAITAATLLSCATSPALLAQVSQVPEAPSTTQTAPATTVLPEYLPEAVRRSFSKVVLVPGMSPPDEAITGSYDKATPGLWAGAADGGRLGTISQEIGGVNINFPIPILTLPGAIYGGLTGAAKREIQEFRDALAEEIEDVESPPLANEALALDVYQEVGRLPALEPRLFSPTTPVPEDTETVLFLGFDAITIDVDGGKAEITAQAKGTLRNASDGLKLYETVVIYRDRDTLSNWTKNDKALWQDFSNFAGHYLAREIAALGFDRVDLAMAMSPLKTKTVAPERKNSSVASSKALRPTLAWQLELDRDDPDNTWAATIDESAISYEVEIYDNRRLVYRERQVPDPQHALAVELEPCATYRWSVRPKFVVDGQVRYGMWMRFPPEGSPARIGEIVGRDASAAPAYIQDFATLKVKCNAR